MEVKFKIIKSLSTPSRNEILQRLERLGVKTDQFDVGKDDPLSLTLVKKGEDHSGFDSFENNHNKFSLDNETSGISLKRGRMTLNLLDKRSGKKIKGAG